MNDQNPPQTGTDFEVKPETKPKVPSFGAKPSRPKSPRKPGAKPDNDQFGIEPLPKR